MGKDLLAHVVEITGHLRPRVPFLHEAPARSAERSTTIAISQERCHRAGEFGRIVGPQEVLAGNEGKALGPDRRRHYRLAHGEGFEERQPCASAVPYRHTLEPSVIQLRSFAI